MPLFKNVGIDFFFLEKKMIEVDALMVIFIFARCFASEIDACLLKMPVVIGIHMLKLPVVGGVHLLKLFFVCLSTCAC